MSAAHRPSLPRSGWLAIGAATGALLAPIAGAGPALVGGLVALLAAAGTRAAGRRALAMLLAVLAVGLIAMALRLMLTPPVEGTVGLPAGDGPWAGRVVGVGSPRDGSQSVTLDLDVDGRVARVAATVPRYPELVPGDVVEVGGSVRPPPDDGYGDYLRRIGALGTLRARTLERTSAASTLTVDAWRRTAGDALRAALPEPEAGLAAGILIGLRERVDRDLAADFTTAGVSHVVAISGWNIALVAGLVAGVLRGRGRRTRLGVVVVAIAAYTIGAGASPSVLRAAVMAGIVLLARGSGRAGRAAAALGWAVVVLLLLDPALVADAGFQLSVVATAGLLAWASPITERLERVGDGRLPGWLAESLGVSLAAQAATLPIILASFGRLSLIAPLVNIAVVPLVPLAMAAGVLALAGGLLALAGLPAVIATALGLPAWLALTAIVRIVRLAAGVPLASVDVPAEVAGLAGLLSAVAILGVAIRRRHPARSADPDPLATGRRRPAAAPSARPRALIAIGLAALTTISLGGLAVVDRVGRATTLTVLDVGQGDALLLETREGSRLLVDGGPDPDRLLVALDERIPAWDRRIDVVVLSHPHEDHVAGLATLLARYQVRRVLEPGMRGPGPGWRAWDEVLGRGGVGRGTIATGGRLRLDEVALDVLWPDPGSVPREPADTGTGINNVSVVFLGEAAGRRFLLAGDIEEEIDPVLLARGVPRVDILKVAHHGSATASTDAFLDAAHPMIAIASAGAGNPYGHPAPSTLGRLRERGARVFRTDRDGSVELRIAADGIRASATGPRAVTPGSRMRTAAAAARPAAFQCALPLPAVRRRPDPATAPHRLPPLVPRRSDEARGAIDAREYHRPDDDPRPDRGCPPALVARPAGVVRAARGGGGRRRRLAGPTRRRRGPGGRPSARRGGRAPPRRGQAARHRPCRPRAPPRRGIGDLARAVWGERARRGRPRPPGDRPRGRRRRPAPRRGTPRGPPRRLRGQAGRPAAGVDGRPVRFLGAALPGRLGRRDGRPRSRTGGAARARDLRRARDHARRRPPAGVGATCDRAGERPTASRRMTVATRPALAHFRGDDSFSLDRAAQGVADRLAAETGSPPERWRTSGTETSLAQLAERIATAPLFGGGTLAIVADPGPLLRSKADREGLERAIGSLAPGNGLVFLESTGDGRRAAALEGLEAAVKAAGGEVREFKAPREAGLAAWIGQRAAERGIALDAAAAEELARRVGGFVREGDVDRRGQGALAVAELEKLALYRPGAAITKGAVAELVAAVVPDSTWAMLDAVANRKTREAAALLDRLLETTPEPVILAQLHRRIRELLELADRLNAGVPLAKAAMAIGVRSEFRARLLAGQARAWTVDELEDALEGVLELDAMVKNAPDAVTSERQRRLAFTLWVEERVGGRGR